MLLLWSACKNGETISSSPNDALGGVESADSLFMSFERTPCFGKCPAFKVNLYRNGYATYQGTQFAEYMGLHTGKVKPEIALEILSEAELIKFFDLEPKYDGPVTDLPSMIIEIKTNDKQHRVFSRVKAPAELKTFGKYLDKVFAMVNWTKVESRE